MTSFEVGDQVLTFPWSHTSEENRAPHTATGQIEGHFMGSDSYVVKLLAGSEHIGETVIRAADAVTPFKEPTPKHVVYTDDYDAAWYENGVLTLEGEPESVYYGLLEALGVDIRVDYNTNWKDEHGDAYGTLERVESEPTRREQNVAKAEELREQARQLLAQANELER